MSQGRPELAPEDVAFDQDFVLRAVDDNDFSDPQSEGEAFGRRCVGYLISSGCNDQHRRLQLLGEIRIVEAFQEAERGMRPTHGRAAETKLRSGPGELGDARESNGVSREYVSS